MNINELFERIPFPVKPRLPALSGATGWLNTEPLTQDELYGKVVLVDFWTFTCINWIRTLPYLRAWAETYRAHGLVVVGVHTPEFAIEHDIDSVRRAAVDMGVAYPIAVDNDHAVWNAFANQYWPAIYVADAEGRIHYKHFGEGAYEHTEQVIRRLLTAAGAGDLPVGPAPAEVRGIEVPADAHNMRSPETYTGAARSVGFASPGGTHDAAHEYTLPSGLRTNQWALEGNWTVAREGVVLNEPNGRMTYRFHARDLNLILAPPGDGSPARFEVRLDGRPPHDAHGLDVDDGGNGIVDHPRLYQLIRQVAPIADRHFEIGLPDPGTAAFCFTFG
jgi:thiol-disulfide isomerase/thioredoxin